MAPPKAFISYSWSSPGHRDLIRQYGERLIGDGVEVVLDQWDLSEGQDKYVFMEHMVNDPSVTHVLIFSDRVYSEKANERKDGVGTESQIISKEIYDRVGQKKFLPIVCEKQEDREPCLPVFLQARIWIDFSTPEAVNENWERLLRALHGKPIHEKPALGKPPSHLLEDGTRSALPTIGKFAALREALLNSKPTTALYRQDFLEAAIDYADKLRVRSDPKLKALEEFEPKLLADLHTLLPLRDQLVEWLEMEASLADSSKLEPTVLDLLEKTLALKYRPPELNGWNDVWFEAHSIFVYEMFLYVIAALVKADHVNLLHSVLTNNYLLPESEASRNNSFGTFDEFYTYSAVLEKRNRRLEQRLISPIANLIKERATRSDLTFKEIMQAELLVFLISMLGDGHAWHPHTLVFAGRGGMRFPLFVRAAQHKYFERIRVITGINTADELRAKFKEGLERNNVSNWSLTFHTDVSFRALTNMDALDTIS